MPAPDGEIDAALVAAVEARFHDAHERAYGYSLPRRPEPGRRVGEPARHRRRADASGRRSHPIGAARRPARVGHRRVYFGDRRRRRAVYAREPARPAQIDGPAMVEEFGSTLPIAPRLHGARRRLRQPAVRWTPVIDRRSDRAPDRRGHLASVEAEVEAAIERTARSPMIREARDFRGGIHDRQLPQAHRPLVLGARPADRARLPASRRCGPATSSSTTTSTAPRAASATCPTCA